MALRYKENFTLKSPFLSTVIKSKAKFFFHSKTYFLFLFCFIFLLVKYSNEIMKMKKCGLILFGEGKRLKKVHLLQFFFSFAIGSLAPKNLQSAILNLS